jgi:superfamily II DNA or RNA helicase
MQSRIAQFKQLKLQEKSEDKMACCVAAGFSIPIASLPQLAVARLQEELSVQPRATYDRCAPDAIRCYRVTADAIVVPRVFGLQQYAERPARDERSDGADLQPLTFRGALKPVQEDALARSETALRRSPHACILTLPCGYGKTVVSLKLAHSIGKRTLVVVHKEFLLTQWAARIAQFLPNAKITVLRGSKPADADADFVLGMLQTLCLRLQDGSSACSLIARSCGLVIIDEAHHMAARCFAELFFVLPVKRILGLTATPQRKDGCTAILHLFMGQHSLMLEDDALRRAPPNVRFLKFHAADPHRNLTPVQAQKLKTSMAADALRNALVSDVCVELVREGRNVLCLSERVAHLHALLALFQQKTQGCVEAGLYVGGQKRGERERAETACAALFGTYAMAQEGLDIPRLDSLVLASPATDITQAVGRILRPCAEKQPPLVVDVQDDHCLQFVRQNSARRRFYSKHGISAEGEAPLKRGRIGGPSLLSKDL